MYQTKLIIGDYQNKADEQMNKWLMKNENIEIVDFKYFQSRYGDHSICILYKENN